MKGPKTLALHFTVPVGAEGVPMLVSVTVTVSVILVPWVTVAVLGDTVVDVLLSITVSIDVPELVV